MLRYQNVCDDGTGFLRMKRNSAEPEVRGKGLLDMREIISEDSKVRNMWYI